MILISHRGNIDGKQPGLENMPEYIMDTIAKGYDVEIDVWWKDGGFWLGHDNPVYKIPISFLSTNGLWCHAKNMEAVLEMENLNKSINFDIHYFWHQDDDCTLTSKNIIWVHPKTTPLAGTISVLPEIHNQNVSKCMGVCSDHIENYKNG
jgi:hypothetical protein